ncbi:MAG: Uma2 family endonuclease [Pasteurella sp.]|nr:Uma2 family endonuclease [Pasteurella sp.]MBS9783023.1 Uma2 family endonuclease [Pasteurella sp.]
MNVVLKNHYISPAEYFAIEEDSKERLELIDGQIYAMTGATGHHNTIVVNVSGILWHFLKGKPCRPFAENMKVKIDNNFVYPDVVVDCGFNEDNPLYAGKPTLIIEVLSPSTAKYDIGTKFDMYKAIDSLQEYAVVEQSIMRIDIYRKSDDWNATRYEKGDDVEFQSIGLTVPITEIYDRILFAEDITAKTIRLARDLKASK